MNKTNKMKLMREGGWVFRNKEFGDVEPDWVGPDWIGTLDRIDGKKCFKIDSKDVEGFRVLTKEDMLQIIKWLDEVKPVDK